MSVVLVDSNIILDIFTEDSHWFSWSANQLMTLVETHTLAINPIIYAEVSVRFEHIEDLEEALSMSYFRRVALPWEACFLAAKIFAMYKQRGDIKNSTLLDFYIGAHALISGMSLVTRDINRYKTYFPKLALICPE